MAVPILQIDAFTPEAFKGNPAVVCLLEEPKSEGWMQNVAAEVNQPMTAFVAPRQTVARTGLPSIALPHIGLYEADLRWFTPEGEMPLCGHATLASAHALWETGRLPEDQEIRFHTASGVLTCRRAGRQIEMDFPALPVQEAEFPPTLAAAFEIQPLKILCQRRADGSNGNFLLELDSEEAVRKLKPDFELLRKTAKVGVIVTARGEDSGFDFVSRYFAGYIGIDEDSVTGSAHCALTPYWASVLGKTEMAAYQASARGGVLRVKLGGDRVFLGGEAVTVLRGSLLC